MKSTAPQGTACRNKNEDLKNPIKECMHDPIFLLWEIGNRNKRRYAGHADYSAQSRTL
jgi:hypothetical protein